VPKVVVCKIIQIYIDALMDLLWSQYTTGQMKIALKLTIGKRIQSILLTKFALHKTDCAFKLKHYFHGITFCSRDSLFSNFCKEMSNTNENFNRQHRSYEYNDIIHLGVTFILLLHIVGCIQSSNLKMLILAFF
jgi:hypothetical protein